MGRKRKREAVCIPELEKHLDQRERRYITYLEGAKRFGVPYYTFVHAARSAKANYKFGKGVLVDIEIFENHFINDSRMQKSFERMRMIKNA